MPYSVKVNFDKDKSIEVSGDKLEMLAKLLNEITRKYFSSFPAAKIII